MIEEILQLLGIKPLDEPFLIGRLKVCIEDASALGARRPRVATPRTTANSNTLRTYLVA